MECGLRTRAAIVIVAIFSTFSLEDRENLLQRTVKLDKIGKKTQFKDFENLLFFLINENR